MLNSTYFGIFCFSKYRCAPNKILLESGLNDFTLVKKGTKRTHDEEISPLPLNNKYSNLAQDANLDKQMDENSPTDGTDEASGSSKIKINPFYIEIEDKWTNIAKEFLNLTKRNLQ